MTNALQVKGADLRYLLTTYLFDHGQASVAELIEALDYHGFSVAGLPSKMVSDALRCEIAHGRVRRIRRGRYGPVSMPRAIEHRIQQRVLALHARVASTDLPAA
jgi:hypothetical protein